MSIDYYPHAKCDGCNCPLTERSGSNSYGEFSKKVTHNEKIVTLCDICDPNQPIGEPMFW